MADDVVALVTFGNTQIGLFVDADERYRVTWECVPDVPTKFYGRLSDALMRFTALVREAEIDYA